MNNQDLPHSEENPEIASPEKLKSITRLLKESWALYRLKIGTLLGIIGLPVGFSVLSWILIYLLAETSVQYSVWFSIATAVFSLGSFFLWLWAASSLLYNLKENTGVKDSYRKGLEVLSSYFWVYFLSIAIVIGGFLFFLIPGIMFSIWFSLALLVLIFEGKRGFGALYKSRQMVAGNFWGVLWRFLILGVIVGIGSFLILYPVPDTLRDIVGYLTQLFIAPFFLIYGFLIYTDLSAIKSKTSFSEPKRGAKIRYAVPGILGALILTLLLGVLSLNVFLGRDIPPIDDSDLWLSKVEISEEDNAFFLLKEADEIRIPFERGGVSFDEMVEGKSWDEEFARDLIDENEEFFDLFEKALDRPYFQFPEWQDPKAVDFTTILYNLRGAREIAKLNSVKAQHLLNQGREEEALDLTVKTIKMGQMIQDGPRTPLIGYLSGMAVKDIGLQRLRIMTPGLTSPSESLKDYAIELERFKTNEEGLIRVMKMEYVSFINTKSGIDLALAGKLSMEELEEMGMGGISFGERMAGRLNYLYKPNKTQKEFAEYYRSFINNADKGCYEMDLVEPETAFEGHPVKMLLTENLVGKVMREITTISFAGVLDRKCSGDFSVTGSQILLALKGYQAETGELPLSLSELVPGYFSEVPKDPFDGKSIKYSPDKKMIYSVGPGLMDLGGSEEGDWRRMENPTFKIEF